MVAIGEAGIGEPDFCFRWETDMREMAFSEYMCAGGIEFLELFNGKHGE